MNYLLDSIKGQILNVFPDMSVTFNNHSEGAEFPIWIAYLECAKANRYLSILVVTEANIKIRRMGNPRNATWTICSSREEDLLAMSDAVLVCYGEAAEGGEIWDESTGNKRKGSYRRLAAIKDIKANEFGGYDEVFTTFTEANIKSLWELKPLSDRCDYVNPNIKPSV
jgi:hypothetical protein